MDRTESFESASPEQVRRRLTRRLVAAGVLIVVLLGALAMFDQIARLEPDAPVPPKAAADKAEVPSVGPSVRTDAPHAVGAPPPPPIQATPGQVAAPVDPPPKPEVPADPTAALPAQPTGTAPAATTAVKPPQPTPVRPIPLRPQAGATGSASAVAPAAPAEPPVPEGTAGGEMKPAQAPATTSTAARPLIQQLRRGYVLQAGVFTSTERAEEMRARLVVAGVPVTIESRVQVGPFATPQEAAAAREKIRVLGIESILIPPARASRAAGR